MVRLVAPMTGFTPLRPGAHVTLTDTDGTQYHGWWWPRWRPVPLKAAHLRRYSR